MKKFVSFILVLTLLISFIPYAFGYTLTSNVTIILVDQNDQSKTMGGATITLSNSNWKMTLKTTSTSSAKFSNVPHGKYDVDISLDGYSKPPLSITISGNVVTTIGISRLPSFTSKEPVPDPTPTPTPAPGTPTPGAVPPASTGAVALPKPVSEIKHTDKADKLKALGLFTGGSTGYTLEEPLLRVQGAIMLVRLLGKDTDVKANTYKHPFTDVPEWASNYVGYLYQNKLTYGVGDKLFGSLQAMTTGQYFAFVLRAMGYEDKGAGFNLDNILIYAWMIGLIDNEEYKDLKTGRTFYRDDAVLVSYNALKTRANSSTKEWYFAQKLVNLRAVSKELFIQNGILPEEVFDLNWKAASGPFTYNMNPGGDWEVYRDYFEVVDLGPIGNAKSSTNTFKLSRANFKCGFKRADYMMMRFENGVLISYYTHVRFVDYTATTEEEVLTILNDHNKPLNNTNYLGTEDHTVILSQYYRYIILGEMNKNGLVSYLVLKPKYRFIFKF